jgi:transposase InsO family protein
MSDMTVRIVKLTRGGDYESWALQMRALLMNSDDLSRFLDSDPDEDDAEGILQDKQARGKILLNVSNEMLTVVAGLDTAHATWIALREDYLGDLQARRSTIMSQVTRLKQGSRQSVKEYIQEGRKLLLKLRALEMPNPDMMLVPCFKNGIDAKFKSHSLPHLNAREFEDNFEALSSHFERITMGMEDAAGYTQRVEARVNQAQARKSRGPERRRCFNCGQVGHLKRNCKKPLQQDAAQSGEQAAGKPPVVLIHSGQSVPDIVANNDFIFDSGATHHVVNDPCLLYNVKASDIPDVVLGGGERHMVSLKGDVKIVSSAYGRTIILKDALCVPTLQYNLCSGMMITASGGECWQGGDRVVIRDQDKDAVLSGVRMDGLYKLLCEGTTTSEAKALASVSIDVWHQRLGHPSHDTLKRMARENLVGGLGDLHKQSPTPCDACQSAKQEGVSHPRSGDTAARPCDLLHTDLMDPRTEGIDGTESYVLTIMDDHSRYAEVVLLDAKSDAADGFIAQAARFERQSGQLVKAVRSDRGTEFKGALRQWLVKNGIMAQPSPPYTPQSNGRAERLNKTLLQRTRAMLHHFSLPDTLWEFAMEAAAYTRNRVVAVFEEKTPFELFFGQPPQLSNLRIFGCFASVLIPKKKRDKFDPVNETGIFVGYLSHPRAWKILVLCDGRPIVRESCNVQFDESRTDPKTVAALLGHSGTKVQDPGAEYVDIILPATSRRTQHLAAPADPSSDDLSRDSAEEIASESLEATSEEEVLAVDAQDSAPSSRRYPARERRMPEDPYAAHINVALVGQEIPSSLAAAKKSREWPLWREAVNDELASIFEKGTYTPVPLDELPVGKQAIPTKWVFDLKTDSHGNIERYKARLVVKGFHQVYGIDFEDTFAPTVQTASINFLLAFSAEHMLAIRQLDVKTAFLNGELAEEVYVKVPPGISAGSQVWRLNKALYGLRQAAKVWFDKWTEAMIQMGFVPAQADPCLYVKRAEEPIFIALYVDDVLFFGSKGAIEKEAAQVRQMFETKDLGYLEPNSAKKFLGMELRRVNSAEFCGITLTQTQYTTNVLKRFGMEKANPAPSPMNPGTRLRKEGTPLPQENEYAAIVGSLLYLSVHTRPDITFAVSTLSRFMSAPTEDHLTAAKRVMRYLRKDPEAGIAFKGKRNLGDVQFKHSEVMVYTDSDFAMDTTMSKSTTGVIVTMNGAPLHWKSKLQSIVAQSTCEAEFVAAAAGMREAMWFRKLIKDVVGTEQSKIMLACDNQSAVALLESAHPKVTGRTKHIDVQFWFVLDHVLKQEVLPVFVPTDKMLADGMTKAYDGPKVKEIVRALGMHATA